MVNFLVFSICIRDKTVNTAQLWGVISFCLRFVIIKLCLRFVIISFLSWIR